MATIRGQAASPGTDDIQLPNANGRAAATASRPTVMANEDFAAIGATNESTPALDTDASGLNGGLKRLAARFTTLLARLPAALGPQADATALAVTFATDTAALFTGVDPAPTTILTTFGTNTFTRPADTTAYAVNDIIANSTAAGSVTPMAVTVARETGGKGAIREVKIEKAGPAAATIRAHFWKTSPTVSTAGDNGPLDAKTTKAGYLGYIDVILQSFSDGASGKGLGELYFDLAPGVTDVYCLLEARTVFTPTSASAYVIETTSWPE